MLEQLKRIPRPILIILAIILLVTVINAIFFWVHIVFAEKVELGGYDHHTKKTVELTGEEAFKLSCIYNLSLFGGYIDAEPCCPSYWFRVTYLDGNTLYVGEGVEEKDKMILQFPNNPNRSSVYVTNPWLIDYIHSLIEKYGLPTD